MKKKNLRVQDTINKINKAKLINTEGFDHSVRGLVLNIVLIIDICPF
jgi:hypothetical protein